MTSIRVLCSYGLALHQMDAKVASLNAPIDCSIYMDLLESVEARREDGQKLLYKLSKSLKA